MGDDSVLGSDTDVIDALWLDAGVARIMIGEQESELVEALYYRFAKIHRRRG
jgi:hypothetical protein